MENGPPRLIEAAGGIVERETSEGKLIAVVHRERYGRECALPKGKRKPGETLLETALREVNEETGLSPTVHEFAGTNSYSVGSTRKIAVYWRMSVGTAETNLSPKDSEAVTAEWLSPEQAIECLTHKDQSELILKIYGRRRTAR